MAHRKLVPKSGVYHAPEDVIARLRCDDPDSANGWLRTTVIPDEPLFFGFVSADHETASAPLLERCASVLGYEITM